MLNPIEKFKRSILHLNRSLHHWLPNLWNKSRAMQVILFRICYLGGRFWISSCISAGRLIFLQETHSQKIIAHSTAYLPSADTLSEKNNVGNIISNTWVYIQQEADTFWSGVSYFFWECTYSRKQIHSAVEWVISSESVHTVGSRYNIQWSELFLLRVYIQQEADTFCMKNSCMKITSQCTPQPNICPCGL